MRDPNNRFPDEDQVPKIPSYMEVVRSVCSPPLDDRPLTAEEGRIIGEKMSHYWQVYRQWFQERNRCSDCWGYGETGAPLNTWWDDGPCIACNGTGDEEVAARKRKNKGI